MPGGRQRVGVVEGVFAQPGDVDVGLVPGDQLVVSEAAEPFGLDAFRPVVGSKAVDEVREVGGPQRGRASADR
jgi:hypothetical protein